MCCSSQVSLLRRSNTSLRNQSAQAARSARQLAARQPLHAGGRSVGGRSTVGRRRRARQPGMSSAVLEPVFPLQQLRDAGGSLRWEVRESQLGAEFVQSGGHRGCGRVWGTLGTRKICRAMRGRCWTTAVARGQADRAVAFPRRRQEMHLHVSCTTILGSAAESCDSAFATG